MKVIKRKTKATIHTSDIPLDLGYMEKMSLLLEWPATGAKGFLWGSVYFYVPGKTMETVYLMRRF